MLRTIRLDASDASVFELAAGPDEIAVPGGFAFAGLAEESLKGKTRQAFSNGFLGLASFGRSTFVAVTEASEHEIGAAVETLAAHLVEHYGAPDLDAARPAARGEVEFARELAAEAQLNTLLTVKRELDEDGEIREAFRIVTPPSEPQHTRIWDVVDE